MTPKLIQLKLTKDEVQTLYDWMKREFIPHDNYTEIKLILDKFVRFLNDGLVK